MNPPSATSTRRNASTLRAELLEATVQLMARHGSADQLTLRGIAREVGVSPTAVYRHFEGHEEMVVEAVTQCWNEFDAVMAEAAATEDPFDAMHAAGLAYLTFAEENPGRYQIMFSNHISVEDTGDDCVDDGPAADEGPFDILVSIVQRILTELDDPRDARFVSFQVFSWVHGMASLAQNMEKLDWPGAVELLARVGPSLGLDRPDTPTSDP